MDRISFHFYTLQKKVCLMIFCIVSSQNIYTQILNQGAFTRLAKLHYIFSRGGK